MLDAEAPLVEVADGLAELVAAAVGRVLVRLGLGDRLLHGVDDQRGRRAGRGRRCRARSRRRRPRLLGGDLALELGEQVRRDPVQALSSVACSSSMNSSASSPRYTGTAQPVRFTCRSSSTSTSSSPPSSARSRASRRRRARSATAAPLAPVPEDSVSPTPRSKMRARIVLGRALGVEGDVGAVGEELVCARSAGRSAGRSSASGSSTGAMTHCGLPIVDGLVAPGAAAPASSSPASRESGARGPCPPCRWSGR